LREEHQPILVAVREREKDVGLAHLLQRLERIGLGGADAAEAFEQLAEGLVADCDDDLALVLEVAVERGGGDADARAERSDRHAVHALLEEKAARRRQDFRAALMALAARLAARRWYFSRGAL